MNQTSMYIHFIRGTEEVHFEVEGSCPIPRKDEAIAVREFSPDDATNKYRDKAFIGIVKEVSWYFSSGNHNKPVVTIYIDSPSNFQSILGRFFRALRGTN